MDGAGREAQKSRIFITVSSTGPHTEKPLPLAPPWSWNIKFYVAGAANVPRMWIDRCIKQPSKPISNGTNASKGLLLPYTERNGERNIATHYACCRGIESLTELNEFFLRSEIASNKFHFFLGFSGVRILERF